jgi:RimJ/RimL family protein N-acetyltransferase
MSGRAAARVTIERASLAHAAALRDAIDLVARERVYLATLEAFPLADVERFVAEIADGAGVQFVAVAAGHVIGWIHIVRNPRDGFGHCGTLGMGLLPDFRGRGLGAELLERAVDAASKAGITRIELEAFATNRRAIKLYERAGFSTEGVKKRARVLDGRADDMVCMALLLEDG